jgi:4-carboxymuconolactone decarboxylase
MQLFAAMIISLSLFAWGCAPTSMAVAASDTRTASPTSTPDSQLITITRSGAQPSRKAPAEYFTGSVRIDPLFEASDPARTSGGSVTFEPGTRTAWHTHPLGQILIVTAGVGRVQRWGGPIEEIRQGDVVRIPAGLKHWHGASPNTAMAHIGIVERFDGKTVDWLEKVSDAQYAAPVQVQVPASGGPAAPAPGASAQPTRAQQLMGDIVPKLADLTDTVLFGDVWARPELSPRDRSLVTVSALIALNRPDQLRSHLARARENGVTQEELIETITHLAFYAGWPNAITAIGVAREVFRKK